MPGFESVRRVQQLTQDGVLATCEVREGKRNVKRYDLCLAVRSMLLTLPGQLAVDVAAAVTFVDSRGNRTQEVYEQCNKRLHKRVFAIKSKSADGIPYVSIPKKVNILKGKERKVVVGTAWLYTLGVDAGNYIIVCICLGQRDTDRRGQAIQESFESG